MGILLTVLLLVAVVGITLAIKVPLMAILAQAFRDMLRSSRKPPE